MIIIHSLDNFLGELFPRYKSSGNDLDVLKEEIEKYYTLGPFKPKVLIENDFIKIEIDTSAIIEQHKDFHKAVRLCDNKQYDLAQPILEKLIDKNPTNSEYHRIKGQILSEQGNQEDAINVLIEALRWDPKNGWALIMMGNIFAKDKKDIETAKIYFDQAIKSNPNDHISVNNIAALFMQEGDYKTTKEYCEKALEIEPTYPNTHFILSVIAEHDNDLNGAFSHVVDALKHNRINDELKKKTTSRAVSLAYKLMTNQNGFQVADKYRQKLELESGIEIRVETDHTITSPAKMELAENYGREYHLVKYKSKDDETTPHLLMHELVHLDFILQAQKAGNNQLFISTSEHKEIFNKKYTKDSFRLIKMGLEKHIVAEFMTKVFQGINSQVFNTPVDLFIEQKLYDEFPDIRPYQFLSLYKIISGNIKATTDKSTVDLSPKHIVTNSKILGLIQAMQFREIYGLDFTGDFKANKQELDEAVDMYGEYIEYKDDKDPGEEYELVANWAKDLGLDEFFELIDEKKYRSRASDINKILESIENDPFDLESGDSAKEKKQDQFYKHRKETGVNQAVAMYMFGALEYFKEMPKDQIKKIAMEIALQGAHGYETKRKDYKVGSIPGKVFTGYQILAYYYVSFKLAVPELIDQLGLPYDEEYDIAKEMFEKGK